MEKGMIRSRLFKLFMCMFLVFGNIAPEVVYATDEPVTDIENETIEETSQPETKEETEEVFVVEEEEAVEESNEPTDTTETIEELPEETVIPTEENQPQEVVEKVVEKTEPVVVNEPINEVDILKRNINEATTIDAVVVEGEGSNNSALVIQKLDETEEYTLEQLQDISKHLFDELDTDKIAMEGKESEKDGMRIEGFSMRFVDTEETQLQLSKETTSLLLQVNYKLESDHNYAVGDVVFTFPDQFLKDADGNPVGEILFPYEENNPEQAFQLLHEGGKYLLSNQKELNASTRGYFHILIQNIDVEKIQEALPLQGTLEVLKEEESIGLKTKEYTVLLPEKEEKIEQPEEVIEEQEETITVDLSDSALLSEEEVQVLPEAKNEALLEEKNLSFAAKKLMAGPFKAPPTPQTPVTADHITIEKVTIRWVSPSSGSEESAMYDDLRLVPTNDIVPNQQWQLDVAFSGKDEIKAGDLEIVLPAYIWLDRDGNEPGLVTVAVPREGSEGARVDFVWKRVGDNIVVTNTRNLSAATKYMIQGTFRMTSPDPNADPTNFTSTYAHQMIDGVNGITDYISNDLFGVIYVTTPNTGETISMTSNVLNAILDTHVEVANASKTAYDKYAKKYNIYYHHDSGDVPSELLPDNPEDYLYIKWYVDGRAVGNQPFTMTTTDTVQDVIYKVEGTNEIPIQAEGLMLGASNTAEGTVKSTDGKTVTATLFEGFTEDDKSAYIWTAYKKSYFEGIDASFKVYNEQIIKVKGVDDQVETSTSASASVAIRLPIVWTIKKEWIYNEDKYDTPLEVIKSRQPETLKVWLDNKSTGQKKVFDALLSDENNWTVEYEDDGVVANYDAFEHSYEVTRHMHGEDGTSIDIVTGRDDTVYTDDGRWYYKYWGYDHKSTKYDEETHTWTFVNDYHEGIIGGGYDDFEVAKEATNHTDQNQKSSSDKDLNLLINGQNSTSINYDVHTGTFCLGHTSEPGARSWEVDKHGKRYVTLELHDYGEYFESRKLRNDEFRMATVKMQLPEIYSWVPEEEGSESGSWVSADSVPVSLYARGGDSTEWTLYAIMDVDESITTYNGATVEGKTVNLPEGMNETMETIRTNGARASLDYNVGVILFPSQDIKDKISEIFESTDYAKAHSFNYVTGRLLDDDKNVLGELERYDRTYLHGRVLRLAVDLDKETEFTGNDKNIKQMTFDNKITLNQQSNITSLSDYHEYFNNYLIPGSKSGTFYDLLPEGMTADVSTVRVENGTAKMIDVFDDYKGTGRQLLVVKVDIEEDLVQRDYRTRDSKRNDDSYPNITSIDSTDVLYGTKATLYFQSLYSYDEARNRGITNLRNTAAYEADEEVFGNVDKWTGEKDAPTGENHKESLTEVEDYLREAMTDLDAQRDDPNFVYAGSTYRITEADFDGLSSLRKYVQAAGDEEWVDGLDNSVYVYEGGKYNYRIVLTSDTDTITKDIILIDSIEYYTPMEILEPGDSAFNVGQIVSKRELDHRNELIVREGGTPATAKEVWYWKGYFKSIDVSEIEGMGVDVKVYYSTVPDLDITHDAYNPEHTKEAIPEKLADPTVWSTELPADPSTVTAVALDCRKAKDGSDFELNSQESLIFYMHMQAPTYEQQPEAYGEEGYNDPMNNGWAYNNVYMDITQLDDQAMAHETHSYDHYDYTKVGIWALDIEVQKEWDDKNDNDRVRPDSVEVHLIREGVDTGRSLTLDETNNWYGKFPHVLMYDEDGNRIYYSLNENPVEGYNSKIYYDSQNMTLINSRETEKVNIPFVKKWKSEEPDGWQDNIPSSIKVKLFADGVFTGEVKTVRPDEGGNWTGIFTNMDKYKDGIEVVYTIEEDVPQDFICEIDQENKVITNTYYPYGHLSVEKKVINGTSKALEKTFTYTLTLKDADGESIPNQFDYVITDKEGAEKKTGQIGNGGTFTLQDQEKIMIYNLNSGIKYEVKETQTPGFTITSQIANQGIIRSDKENEAKFENTYHAYGSASFEGTKDLTGRDLERFQFRFEVLDSDGNTLRIASNDANGKVTFGAINYTEADDGKVYVYTIKEQDRGKGGISYDTTEYTAEVHPVDNGDGTMTCEVIYMKGTQIVDKLDFTNEYHAEGEIEFKAWKALKGRSLTEGEFTFILEDKDGNEVARATNMADGSITFPAVHFDEEDAGQEFDFIMSEVTGNDVTVNYSNEMYKFHVAVVDNGDGTLTFTKDITELELIEEVHVVSVMDSVTRMPHPDYPVIINDIAVHDYSTQGITVGNWRINQVADDAALKYYNDEFDPVVGDIQTGTDMIVYLLDNGQENYRLPSADSLPDGLSVATQSASSDFYWIYKYSTYSYEEGTDPVTPIFTNDLKKGELKITKYTKGGNPDQAFKFRLVLEGEDIDQDFPYEFEQEQKKYITLTYDAKGGHFFDNEAITEATQTYKLTSEGTYELDDEDVENPKRTGYLFGGWYLDEEYQNEWDGSAPSDDMTVYARWHKEEVTVTFKSNGGSYISPVTVQGGEVVQKPEDPTYDRRRFLGWFTDEELTQEYDFSQPVEDDITLYAKWSTYAIISQSIWSPVAPSYSGGRLPEEYRDPSVIYFKRNTILNKDEVIALGAEKVDQGNTESSIYRWISNDTWYWWSDAEDVYMPEVLTHMFSEYKGEEIDLSEFKFSPIKDMGFMFYNCRNLKHVNFGNDIIKIKNSSLRDMQQVFDDCISIEVIDLSNFDTRESSYMGWMFDSCSSLTTIYVSDLWSTDNVTTSTNMFKDCINLPNFSSAFVDKQYAHYGPGGYLTYKAAPTSSVLSAGRSFGLMQNLKGIELLGKRFASPLLGDALGDLVKVDEGVYEFELKGNASIHMKELPAGTVYKVYEETPDGWKLVSQTNENGVIQPLETAHAEFENEYQAGTTSVQFTGIKHLDGEPGNEFTFVLKEDDIEIERVTSENGMIQFSQITYDVQGTHTYTIEEIPGNDTTIEYDTNVETIVVKVVKNDDGTMSKTVTYDEDKIVFENTTKQEYLVGSLTFNKVAQTTEVNKDDAFTFTVNLSGANGLPYSEDVTYSVGTTSRTVTPSSGAITIENVKAGDTISFAELPKGTSYTISEVNLPRGWSLKETSGSANGTIVENDTQSVTFTNEYKANGSVRLEAHKHLVGGTLSEGEYTFTLQDEDGNPLDIQTNRALDTNRQSLDDNDVMVDNPWFNTAPIVFDPISYTQEDIGNTYTYKIVETIGGDGSIIYDTHEETVTVEVQDNGEGFIKTIVTYDADEALFTNELVTGELSLKKEISHYTDTAKETEFSFVIDLKDAEGNPLEDTYPYVKTILVEQPVMGTRINDQGEEEPYDTGETEVVEQREEGNVTSGDTLTLKGNESLVISGLPNGATYTLSEEDAPGWTLSESKNAEGTIQAGETSEALFTNVYTTEGSVFFEATKTLVGAEIIPNTYKFIVRDSNGEVIDYAYAKEDGIVTFNGIDYTAEDDGETYYYYITEEEGKEPHIAYDASSKEVMVKINDNGMGQLECDVTYDENGMEFVNEVGYTLTVSKQVIGEKADPEREFNFTLTLEGLDSHITYQKYAGEVLMGSGTIIPEQLPYTFKLTSDDSIVFDRIPSGVTYHIKEEKDDYYTADQEEKTGTITDTNVEETFVNEINWFDVSFDKVNKEGTLIAGASLAIYQEEELIEEWVSEETSHQTKLLPGDYILKEESVSDEEKYLLASEIPFTVGIDGSVTYDEKAVDEAKVVMVDDYTKTSIDVTKVWEDDDNRDGIRPSEVVVHLVANGEETELSAILNEENDWFYTFEDLDKYANNELIQYEVKEDAIEPYQATITKEDTHFLLTNKYEPEKVNIEIKKVWEDDNNRDGVRPNEITITLYGNGEVVETLNITNTMDWKHTFRDLPKKENGRDIVYEVEEETVTHYDGTVTSEEYRYTITNTHTPGSVALSGTKVWDDGNNQDGVRPSSVTVELYGNGKKVEQVEVSEKTGWKFSFNNLPEKENGKEIVYSIQEKPVNQYTTKITGNAKDGYTITNSHTPSRKPNKPTTPTPRVPTPNTGDPFDGMLYGIALLISIVVSHLSHRILKLNR